MPMLTLGGVENPRLEVDFLNVRSLRMLLVRRDEVGRLARVDVGTGLAEGSEEAQGTRGAQRAPGHSSAADRLDGQCLGHDRASPGNDLEITHCGSADSRRRGGRESSQCARRGLFEEGAEGAGLLEDGLHYRRLASP